MIKPLLSVSLLILLSSVTAACAQNDEPATAPTIEQEQTLIPFKIFDNGKMSGVKVDKTTLYVFDDQDTFQQFWIRHMTVYPTPAPPAVDFKTQTLFAIVDSDQPNGGYYLRFDKAERVNEELWLYVTREQPQTECMNMGMIAQPYVLVVVEKNAMKPKLVFKTNNYPC